MMAGKPVSRHISSLILLILLIYEFIGKRLVGRQGRMFRLSVSHYKW